MTYFYNLKLFYRPSIKNTTQSSAKLNARMSTGSRRIVRTTSSSGVRGGRGTGTAPPLLPAQYVPEELITQAQVVLQGKSRNLIIRELQVRLILCTRILKI